MEKIVTDIMSRCSKAWKEFKADKDMRKFTLALADIGLDYSEGPAHAFYTGQVYAFSVAANALKQEELQNEQLS